MSPMHRAKRCGAVESEDGKIFTGFCIESASGVMNLCAERVAALNMYINTGKTKIKRLIVFRDNPPHNGEMPCGACREFLMQLDKDNKDMAVKIQEYINKKLSTDRSVKKIPGDTYMYSKLNSKGVLVECGFLSNKEERDKLITEEYQKIFAKILGDAIINYYN